MNVKLHVVAIALIVTVMFVFECDTKNGNYWNCHQFEGHRNNVCRYGRAVYEDLIEAKHVVCDDFEKLAFSRCTNEPTIQFREYMYLCVRSEYARFCQMDVLTEMQKVKEMQEKAAMLGTSVLTEMQEIIKMQEITEIQLEAACVKEYCMGQFDDTEYEYWDKSCPDCVELEAICARRICNVSFPGIKKKNYWKCHPFEGDQKKICRYGREVYKDLLEKRQVGNEEFEARAFTECKDKVKYKSSMDACVRRMGSYRMASYVLECTNCTEVQREYECIEGLQWTPEKCGGNDWEFNFNKYSECVRRECNVKTL